MEEQKDNRTIPEIMTDLEKGEIINYLLQNWKEFEPLAQYPFNYSIADQVKDKFHISYNEAVYIVNNVRLLRESFR